MKRKLLITLSALFLIMALSPITALASDEILSTQTTTDNIEIQPFGNITGYIYKIYNGKQWKRLWSYTYNRWEDPKWTLA